MAISDDDAEQALQKLLEAVAFVTLALRARTALRDALIAARDPELAQLAQRVGAAFGFRMALVRSPAEAAASMAGRRFDLVLIEADADTPRWVERLRTLPEPLGTAPVIVLAAPADAAWRTAAADAGADGFVPAPMQATRLIEIIALLMGASGEADAARKQA